MGLARTSAIADVVICYYSHVGTLIVVLEKFRVQIMLRHSFFDMEYGRSDFKRVQLTYAIALTWPLSSVWIKATPKPTLHTSVSMTNGLSKLGRTMTGTVNSFDLRSSRAGWQSLVHVNGVPSLVFAMMGSTIFA